MATSLMRQVGCAALCVMPWLALAQESLPDPTRPAVSVDTLSVAVPAVREILQSVLISPNRKAAIISGETVALGDTFGDSRLLEVNEGAVLLQNSEGKRVLTLFPGVVLKPLQVAKKIESKNTAPIKKAAHKAAKSAVMKEGK
jgi:MSHA biogenesis protein MshK